MSYSFNPQRGLIIIQGELFGPSGSIILRLALDTGATGTMVNVAPLTTIGYDPSLVPDRKIEAKEIPYWYPTDPFGPDRKLGKIERTLR